MIGIVLSAIRILRLRIRRKVFVPIGSRLVREAKIGRNTRVNGFAYIEECSIGAFCAIGRGFTVRSFNHDVNAVMLQGHSMRHVVRSRKNVNWQQKHGVTVGDNTWIGDNVILLDGCDIGHSSVVAAGSVVNKSFPPFSVIGGVPTKLIKRRFEKERRQELEGIDWWNWSDVEIRSRKEFFEGGSL